MSKECIHFFGLLCMYFDTAIIIIIIIIIIILSPCWVLKMCLAVQCCMHMY